MLAEEQETGHFDLADSPSHLLHRAQQAAANLSAKALADQGLTLRQFAVLAALAGTDSQSQAKLVDQTGIDRSTLADMVSRMEKTGLIKRVPSPADARAKLVSLTAKGHKALDAAAPHVAAGDAEIMSMLQASRRPGFLASLALLSETALANASADDDPTGGKKSKGDKSKSDKSAKKKKKKKKK